MCVIAASRRTTPRAGRAGLTLIELVVVLVVIVALAGIVVPLLPNMVQRSHGASGAGNVAEILKAVQFHETLYNGNQPDELDSLINAAGDDLATIVKDDQNMVIARGETAGTLDPQVLSALNQVGITTTYRMLDLESGVNATFAPYEGTTITLDAAADPPTGQVALLTDNGIASLDLTPINEVNGPIAYAVFGLGAKCTAVGKSMAEAPVRFLANGDNPADTYARWLLIYEIPRVGPARLTAIAGVDSDGIFGLNAHLNRYYEAVGQ